MGNYEKLDVWQKAMQLAVDIYKTTEVFPKKEIYGLSSQIQRAAVSIPSNIAEGYSRQHNKEIIQFLHIALGSKAELETQLRIVISLAYIDPDIGTDLLERTVEVGKMLHGLKKRLA